MTGAPIQVATSGRRPNSTQPNSVAQSSEE